MAYIGKSPTGSAVRSRYYYTATGGETSLSGADDNGKTLKFTDGEYVDVHLNGIMLVQGTDYGVGTANTISSLSALAANDIVEIIVYDVYNVAKINSEAMRNRWYFTATGGETSIGTSQISNLVFPANAEIDVKLNGVTLQAGTDYNTTTANTVGGLSALTAGQVVEIVYYEKFVLADTVSKASGGTFNGNVNFSDNIDVTGSVTADDLNLDSNNPRIRFDDSDTSNNGEITLDNTALRIEADEDNAVANSKISFRVDGSDRVTIDASGNLLVGKNNTTLTNAGIVQYSYGRLEVTTESSTPVRVNRQNNDGYLIEFLQAGASEGRISVSGTTVSYIGGHLARWSRLADSTKDTSIVKGTVMTNLDQMVVWTDADGNTEENEQLNCMAVSSVEGDANVAGVFVNWDDEDDYNDMNIAMTGDMVIRIASGTTVARGDLLMSAGDGTAKPQGDDIVRSKTIAKVTSTTVSHTYDDGSYLVPCVLMAC